MKLLLVNYGWVQHLNGFDYYFSLKVSIPFYNPFLLILAQFYWLLDVTWWKITRLLSYLKISHLSSKLHFSAKLLISLTISQVQTLSANIPATWRGFFLNVFSYRSLILCNVSIGEHVINTVTSLKNWTVVVCFRVSIWLNLQGRAGRNGPKGHPGPLVSFMVSDLTCSVRNQASLANAKRI